MTPVPVVLASASRARARMLRAAGLTFDVVPADIDEDAVRSSLEASGTTDPADIAQILCEAKAAEVSGRRPDDLVIGADQVLDFEGALLTKPASKDAARDQLLNLRGKTHRLISAACCVVSGETVWREATHADLTMRDFSTTFLGGYLAAMGGRITTTVGGYEIEGLGIQLFDRIDGDLFTIQGLPLMPLLAFLFQRGVLTP